MTSCSDFWDRLAQHHAEIEDTNFDLASVRRLLPEIESPVLVVGAGQGLIVAELRQRGHECDGVDLSLEMIRHANLRRGMTLVQADAKALPFPKSSYGTVIHATGVIDFAADDDAIRAMLMEGRRVLEDSGKIFVAFYKASDAQADFLERVGLTRNHTLAFRESLEVYLMNPVQMVAWVARRASCSRLRAAVALLQLAARCSRQEMRNTLRMKRVFRKTATPRSLIDAAPQELPYRNEKEIVELFKRLETPVEQLRTFPSCRIAQI